MTDRHWIYFAAAPRSLKVKIGYSTHPVRRVKALSTGNWEEIKLAAVEEVLDFERAKDVELATMATFEHAHIRGEWFELDGMIFDRIKYLRETPLPEWAIRAGCVLDDGIADEISRNMSMEDLRYNRRSESARVLDDLHREKNELKKQANTAISAMKVLLEYVRELPPVGKPRQAILEVA